MAVLISNDAELPMLITPEEIHAMAALVEAYEAFDAEREAAAGRSAGSRKAVKEGRHGRAHQ